MRPFAPNAPHTFPGLTTLFHNPIPVTRYPILEPPHFLSRCPAHFSTVILSGHLRWPDCFFTSIMWLHSLYPLLTLIQLDCIVFPRTRPPFFFFFFLHPIPHPLTISTVILSGHLRWPDFSLLLYWDYNPIPTPNTRPIGLCYFHSCTTFWTRYPSHCFRFYGHIIRALEVTWFFFASILRF